MVTWLKPVWIVDENEKVEEEADKPGNEANDGTDEDTFVDRTAAAGGNVEWHFSSLRDFCVHILVNETNAQTDKIVWINCDMRIQTYVFETKIK